MGHPAGMSVDGEGGLYRAHFHNKNKGKSNYPTLTNRRLGWGTLPK
jgi:hypothetical protein